MAYAEKTDVPVATTKMHIEKEVLKRGGDAFGIMSERNAAMVVFALKDRRIRFDLRFDEKASEQQKRSRWRALFLVIKAKLESVEANIETVEDAFLSQTVMPDGSTVGDTVKPWIRQGYVEHKMPPLLPAPASSERREK